MPSKALDFALTDRAARPTCSRSPRAARCRAWGEAVDGDDAALLAIATPQAARSLLYASGGPQGGARIVVRGPKLLRLAITALHTDNASPRMDVEARVRGRCYIEDRDTVAVLGGDKNDELELTERWTFALAGSPTVPWRLVATTSA